MFAKSPMATLYTEGFDSFVTSTAAPVASGWSDQLPGGSCTHWEYAAFPRRTETFRLGTGHLLPDEPVDVLLQHRHRQRAGAEHSIVETAHVETFPQRVLGLLP